MHLSIFTDEVSPNPQRAMALAAAWDIRAVEVRNLPGGRFPRVADAELAEFGRWVEAAGLRVSGVSPVCLNAHWTIRRCAKVSTGCCRVRANGRSAGARI